MKLFSSAILLTVVGIVSAQENCISKLSEIYRAESELELTAEVLNQERTYVLCKDKTYYPGRVNVSSDQGKIDAEDDTPLVCRSKCRIECQDNAKTCFIDGGNSSNGNGDGEAGTYGIVFMPPQWTFGKDESVVNGVDTDITVVGVTVQNWIDASNQIPIAIASSSTGSTDITFSNCNFENNIADPLFLIDEISSGDNDFTINFDSCQFKNNSPSVDAQTQGGLSLLRFRGIDDVNNPIDTLHDTSNLNAKFTGCDFENNSYYFENNDEDSLALIDFYSKGTLLLKDNCFKSSPTQNHGVITVQDGATVTNENNHYEGTTEESRRICPFISVIDAIYENRIGDCTTDDYRATAGSCRGEFIICFPGDTTVETIDGNHVPLSNIQLGDQIRVPTSDEDKKKKYETVYSFGHRSHDETETADFLQFQFSNKKKSLLEMSSDHMVYLPRSMSYVPASMIRIGDYLQQQVNADNSGDDESLLKVRAIRKITKSKGVYAPFTTSGTFLVNDGIVVSSYVAFQKESSTLRIHLFNDYSINTGITHQSIAHSFQSIHRLYCSIFQCTTETYTKEGLSTWIAFPHYIVTNYIFNTNNNNNNVMMKMFLTSSSVIVAAIYYMMMTQKKRKTI